MKKMKISSFLKISWFGVRICNFESKFSFFFICNFIFFHFPLFLMVFHFFHCFSWLSWISGATGKENEKKMKKKKISSSFWRFPCSEWESATLSPNFHFVSFATSCFFSFSFVFDGFPLFFMVFLDFRCHGKGKWKKNDKKMKFKMKKMKFEMKKNDVWNEKKWSLEKQKMKKKKNKWKINENKKILKNKMKKWSYKWKPKWKINEKNNFKHFQSVARCESYNLYWDNDPQKCLSYSFG